MASHRAGVAHLEGLRDRSPHRTQRIRKRNGAQWEIGCGAWRAVFEVVRESVNVVALEAAYPMRFLMRPNHEEVPDRDAQLAFIPRWPLEPTPIASPPTL